MHITQDSLASMSLDDVRAERARQEIIWKGAVEAIAMCEQAIADRIAEFKVGDCVVDTAGVNWQVTRIGMQKWSSKERVAYHGRRIKKDGSVSAIEREIYNQPLRATPNGEGANG
ncbi:hypothetical protein HAP94_13150 [Acidithiobacillus ferrivorans]|nr:hypothetical protein [Acidithiobacillus ferrivorans]